ncbi:alpha/beta-hydrolase [Pleomassaria siparia CBS 279.74]|uniref:Alpha/beta-hydrolase n=1 Tax=Pleomassaria siparia CBS 279.74 TaxID=1314801 RepID=A0A6G1JYD5_9PLEO|nr:alpha/beta-hydrolase [Pleomassaria siparia CBS 279.74]
MKTCNDADNNNPPSSSRRARRDLRWKLLVSVVVVLFIFQLELSFPFLKQRLLPWLDTSNTSTQHEREIDWDSLDALDSFEFQPCYHGFECARLKVPFDYFNGTYLDSSVGLAVIKLPAKVPIDDPRYGGPILINPGGPGGPGVDFALVDGKNLQIIADSAVDPKSNEQPENFLKSEKYFDIISFDPRGVGWTNPLVSCMSDEPSSWSWMLREQTEGILGSSDAAMGRHWSMSHAYGSSCKQAMDSEEGPDIKQYMTTASVARDMLEIVEKHAEYVAKNTAKLAAEKSKTRPRGRGSKPQRFKANTAKLQYWGFSYGTYLGATFASMFPDRVGRMVLDGVVNSEDYNTSLGNGSLHDSEKAMSSFYTFCVAAGPELCPLTTPTSDAKDIEIRVQAIIQSIYHNPVQISSALGPDIFTYSDVKMLLFSSIYQPMDAFPFAARMLAAVEKRGGDIIDQIVQGYRPTHIYSCPINGTEPLPRRTFSQLSTFAILCSDGQDQSSVDMESFEEYLNLLVSISPTSGSIWSLLRLKCASWKIRAVRKFGDDFGGNTSHPIFWISNTADPVTPLRSGKIMSEKFPRSVLLVQDSAGHCSFSNPSPCTLTHTRTYFQHGTLPPPNTLCVPPKSHFSLNSTDSTSPFYDVDIAHGMSHHGDDYWSDFMQMEQGKNLMDAAVHLRRSAAERRHFGVGGSDKVERMRKNWMQGKREG